ncbi:MAG: Uma2 family endonuclease [Sandaracinaceae bacterium]
MSEPARHLATYADLLRLPEDVRAEILAGELVTSPAPLPRLLSPSTSARDRVTKRHLYATHGVPHGWLVDPDAKTLEAVSLREGNWMLTGSYDDTATARIAPFDAIELEIGRLFLPK